jgi:tRNA guanosine-2'-O-methyltransferase
MRLSCQCQSCIPAKLAGLCDCPIDIQCGATWDEILVHFVQEHQTLWPEFARRCAFSIPEIAEEAYRNLSGEDALSWLRFIKLLHQFEKEIPCQRLVDNLKSLGSLSKTNPAIALIVADITLICLQRAPLEIGDGPKPILADQFPWSTISSGIQDGGDVFSLWVKWLSLPALFRPSDAVLQSEAYWTLILDGLRHGPTQKLSLHILQRSVSLFQLDIQTSLVSIPAANIKAAETAVNRYCRLFETIVIGRYLNQVVDCLKQLPSACFLDTQTDFPLSNVWWRALLTAALSLRNVEGVRRLVGNWILDQRLPNTGYDKDFSLFLVGPLMAWSCQGYLFHNSLLRKVHVVSCSHGSRWASFISSVLNSGDRKARSRLTIDILKAVKDHVRHVHAILFTLCGLDVYSNATTSGDHWSPDELQTLKALTSDISGAGLSQHQSQMFDAFVQAMLYPGNPGTLANDSTTLPQFQDCHNIAEIHAMLCSNDPSLPKQDRLSFACLRADQILQSSNSESPVLHDLLKDLWRFSVQQDLPRTMLEIIPRVFFGNASLEIAESNNDLRGFLSLRLMDLLKLCRRRIYCWNPLASAIHRAYRRFPNLPSILPIQDFIVGFARQPPVAAEPYLLDSAISQEIQGPVMRSQLLRPADEGLGYGMVFDMMNRLRTVDSHWGRSVIDILLSPFLTGSGLAAFSAPSTVLQSVLLLSGRCISEPDQLADFRAKLLKCLASGVSPIFRFLVEVILLASYWSRLHQAHDVLVAIDDAAEKDRHPRFIASLLRVACWISKHDQVDDGYVKRLSATLLALCTSDKMAIRQEAGWSFWQLMDLARERKILGVSEDMANQRIDRYIRTLKRFHEPSKFRALQTFDPKRDQTLSFLIDGPYLLVDGGGAGVAHQEDFQKLYADPEFATGVDLPPEYLPLGQPVEKGAASPTVMETSNSGPDMPFQSKSFLPPETYDLETSSENGAIILIASLIDSLPNLGGICRAAEIYGCQELHIANQSASTASAFTSVSVSSENNIRIVETKPDGLTALLREKRAEGWSILGVEQTGSSLILGEESTRLPRRAVLVLGAEKTGMPAEVLVECDTCVEIKQWGTTRSLNVQTAAATVLYEWRRQWEMGNKHDWKTGLLE